MKKISERFGHLSPIKQAFLALEDMQSKLEAKEKTPTESIAIIGIGCRFPGGANNPESFWQMLHDGVDATGKIPSSRWDIDAYYDPHPGKANKMSVRRGGFLNVAVDEFDAQFFELAPREVVSMDPQQRLLLEVSWEALEYAGIAPEKLSGCVGGVFLGINPSDYSHLHLNSAQNSDLDTYFFTGNTPSVAAGRLSYNLGLKGPTLAVDTSCSSSLISVHLACQSLRNQECSLALAGGANLILSPQGNIILSKMRALASDGRCKTFDAQADGYGRGEGCGMVVLKRLSTAIADGDNILALIRGSASNHDGRSSGLTVPNGIAQQEVIQTALAQAKVDPDRVSYVEVHGTGTALGDPIEAEALGTVFSHNRSLNRPLKIGSVKTNIGHLEAAAGIASLIKVVLAIQHQQIPPHLHLNQLNPALDWENLPLEIPTKLTPWQVENAPSIPESQLADNDSINSNLNHNSRIAGISSFGMSGTNVHLVVEEMTQLNKQPKSTTNSNFPNQILTLSAKSEKALEELVLRYQNYLAKNPHVSIEDFCFTTNTGRAHFNYRLAIIASTTAQILEQLKAFSKNKTSKEVFQAQVLPQKQDKVAFLFTGQGSEYVGMGYELYQTQPIFRQALDKCDRILSTYLPKPLLEVLYPDRLASETIVANADSPVKEQTISNSLEETSYSHTAIFALEYALFELWTSWGIKPTIVMGHSLGEYMAGYVAGVFSLEDAFKLVASTSLLRQKLPQTGQMVRVFASEERVLEVIKLLAQPVEISAIDGFENVVISGDRETIDILVEKLTMMSIKTKSLQVSDGLHSHLIEPILAEFQQIAAQVKYHPTKIKFISNLTGKLVEKNEVANPEYWCRRLRLRVQFDRSIQTLQELGYKLFLEIGATPTLSKMGSMCPSEDEPVWLSSLGKGEDGGQQILPSLAQLYIRGVEVNWQEFYRHHHCNKIPLPTYPFQRQRYWLDSISTTPKQGEKTDNSDLFYQIQWELQPLTLPISTTSRQQGSWLILADSHSGMGQKLTTLFKKRGQDSVLVFTDQIENSCFGFEQLLDSVLANEQYPCQGIIHLLSLESRSTEETMADSGTEYQFLTCGSVLHLVQALGKKENSQLPRLWVVTQDSQAVGENDPLNRQQSNYNPIQSPIWGLGRVVAIEHPEIWGGAIDLESNYNLEETASILVNELWQAEIHTEVAFRQGQRYVSRLVQSLDNTKVLQQFSYTENGTYLITGGTGGLGLKLASWMVDRGAKHLVLMGRKKPNELALETIERLNKAGAKVDLFQGDVSKKEDVALVVKKFPSIKGVIHLAGILDDGVLRNQNWDRFLKVMTPKIVGAWNLHYLTQELPIDFFACFSSIASVLGSPGQGNYAAGNMFLDSLAHYRQLQGLPAVTINWSPWGETGMAATLGDRGEQRWTAMGVSLIEPSQGFELFERILNLSSKDSLNSSVGILPIDWSKFFSQFPEGMTPRLLSKIAEQTKQNPETEQTGLLWQELQNTPVKKRKAFLIARIQNEVAWALGLGSSEAPEPHFGFFELGMDSLMALEFRNRLQIYLAQPLPSTLIFEYPNIEAIVNYILEDLLAEPTSSPSPKEEDTQEQEAETLKQFQELSEDELSAFIDRELESLIGD